MEERTCPICGKPVGDYLKDNIRCGKCGSNLEVYRLLHEVDDDLSSKGLKWKPTAIAASVLALVFALLYFFTPKTINSADSELLVQLEDSITVLNGKIKALNGQTAEATTDQKAEAKDKDKKNDKEQKAEESKDKKDNTEAEPKKEEPKADPGKVFEKDGKKYYTVQPGDSWWKVCAKLYGPDKVPHGDIAKLNGKSLDYKLKVGETIQVK